MRSAIRGLRGREVNRSPEIDMAVAKHERPRHHANDFVPVVVHQDRPADDGGVAAETPLPESVADDHDLRTGAVFLVGERPAALRRHAEDAEEIRRDQPAEHLLGLSVAGQARCRAARGGDVLEGTIQPAPLVVIARRGRVLRNPREAGVFPEHDEAVGVGEGQGADHHRVDHRKNRRVGADAQGQRGDGNHCEEWGFSKQAAAVPADRKTNPYAA